ncbi:hypothetical protein Kpol_1037p18 [Vanderwaltozyma polyspora DSM 70294]|uniref:Uncharacterized protein n=1 Tax=Vanderwaltozyma polyspora (strain ATCC 22028 / DSM 70294 / BCRC 21397 / CBS 2163 / NBRC 10782 / NRRL Y-8283 / UCD 57-17) TaxID=436907 RepID=A7TJW0_VANPO|nr:uncharacterized protein Kpol_1037p18 [Vanderwaltozyma polyspora DSM 70294]EDO17422.1 hypothetical protein Kpol_1037p18 [Vanderwaltozyma polyspora DSM 70294]
MDTVLKRGLPKLVTSTSTSTSTTSTSSSSVISTSKTTSTVTGSSTTFTSISTSMITSSSASSSLSSSSTTSYSHSVWIPSATNNKYIRIPDRVDGTVFIAVGSCLGFVIGIILILWMFLTFKAWRNARKESKIRLLENKYNPYMGDHWGSMESIDYSHTQKKPFDIESGSSIVSSESEMMASFVEKEYNLSHKKSAMSLNTLFVSPTSHIMGPTSTVGSTTTTNTTNIIPTSVINLNSGVGGAGIEGNINNKPFRPPSVHLDELLDKEFGDGK